MGPEARKAAALKAANDIHATAKAAGRGFTEDEQKSFDQHVADAKAAQTEIDGLKKADDSAAILADLAGEAKSDRLEISDRNEGLAAKTFGEAFVKSPAYEAFRKSHPSGVGAGSTVNIGKVKLGTLDEMYAGRKAPLTTTVGRIQPVRMPTVDLVDRPRLTLLDLISRGETAGSFEYLQVTAVTRNAAIVAEATSANDGLKPVSDLSTQLADAKVYTYADGYDVTNSLLSDAPALATYMTGELRYSLDSVIEDKLINGTGLDGEPKGILGTTGVQEQTYVVGADAMAFVKGIRQGVTKITRIGGTVSAILISPEDDEAIDLMQDNDDRFFGGGPFTNAPGTLWGRPRVISERLTAGQAILGDFKQIALLDREGLSVEAFNQHADYARRNLTYVRAELRAAQAIWKPARLAVVKPAV